MKNWKLKKGDLFQNRYEILNPNLGKGGNGTVCLVFDKKENTKIVLKYLSPNHWEANDRVKRFQYEIDALRDLHDVEGVIPILDFPKDYNTKPLWYTMPLAIPFSTYFKDMSKPEEVTRIFLKIAHTLVAVHEMKRTHRDIKPDNLFILNSKPVIGDFGLVKNPHTNDNLTKGLRKLGPTFYIAPEMLNSANDYEGYEADTFSLAKSIWAVLTGLPYPIPGQHDLAYTTYTLQTWLKDGQMKFLDYLISRATFSDPNSRISMADFAYQLEQFINMKENNTSHDFSILASELSAAIQPSRKFRYDLQSTNVVTKEIVTQFRSLIEDDIQNLVKAIEKQIGNGMDDLPKIQESANLSGRLNDLKLYDKKIWSREGLVFGIWLNEPIHKRFDAGFCIDSYEDGKSLIYCGFRMGPIQEDVNYFNEFYKIIDLYTPERENTIHEAADHFKGNLGSAIRKFLEYITESPS